MIAVQIFIHSEDGHLIEQGKAIMQINTVDWLYTVTVANENGRPPLQVANGGTVGSLIDIKEQLDLYAYSLGFQRRDEKAHAANEFIRVSSLRKGQLVYCYYLQHISE